MGSFTYGSGLWPDGMTLPASGSGYSQKLADAESNFSNAQGMAYPIAIPRIDSNATSGTGGNHHIIPYSAEMFWAALSGIKTEYSFRDTTVPKFYAYLDANGTVKNELTSASGLLSMPLSNFHYLIRDAYTAISGLVCMDGWNDDMVDYMRRVFDYRVLLKDVPSGYRLQDNVSYASISGTSVTINPLTRARAGQFPLNLDDVKYLGSKWGINPDGSRNYGSGVFSGSGVPVGADGTRSPHFQQATFMGHFDWLVQSILWRPPVTESFTQNKGERVVVANYNRESVIAHNIHRTIPWFTDGDNGEYELPGDVSSDAEATHTVPSGIIPGDYSTMTVGGTHCRPAFVKTIGDREHKGAWPTGDYGEETRKKAVHSLTKAYQADFIFASTGPKAGTDGMPGNIGDDSGEDMRFFEQIEVENTGDELRVKMKDFFHCHPRSAYGPNYGQKRLSENGDGWTKDAVLEDNPDLIPSGWTGPYYRSPGYSPAARNPSGYKLTHHPFQSCISWGLGSGVSPLVNEMNYPIGSGSQISIDISIDSRTSAASHWTSLVGRNDWEGTHLCFMTNKHLPTRISSDQNDPYTYLRTYLNAGTKHLYKDINGIIVSGQYYDVWSNESVDSSSQYEIISVLPASVFNSSGALDTGYYNIRTAPSLIQTYFSAGVFNPTLVQDGVYPPHDRPGLKRTGGFGWTNYANTGAGTFGNSVYSIYGDFPVSWPTMYSDGDDLTNTAWNHGVKNLSNADYPSGTFFSTLKIEDVTPSGTVYTLDLWSKFQEDMLNLSSHWPTARAYYDNHEYIGGTLQVNGQTNESGGDAIAQSLLNAVAYSGMNPAATPTYGHIADNDEGVELESISFVDLATALDGTGLPGAGVGYTLRSFTLKFPIILGPSGLK